MRQDREPDLDLIETMRRAWGVKVKGDAMLRVAQECFTRPLGSEHARFAFDAEVGLEAAGASNEADDGLERWMLRLSQTMSHLALGAALLSKWRRNRAKSFSVRVLPITPSTAPVATSKAAIKV